MHAVRHNHILVSVSSTQRCRTCCYSAGLNMGVVFQKEAQMLAAVAVADSLLQTLLGTPSPTFLLETHFVCYIDCQHSPSVGMHQLQDVAKVHKGVILCCCAELHWGEACLHPMVVTTAAAQAIPSALCVAAVSDPGMRETSSSLTCLILESRLSSAAGRSSCSQHTAPAPRSNCLPKSLTDTWGLPASAAW